MYTREFKEVIKIIIKVSKVIFSTIGRYRVIPGLVEYFFSMVHPWVKYPTLQKLHVLKHTLIKAEKEMARENIKQKWKQKIN